MTSPLDIEGGAAWKGRRATRLQPGSREIKMLRPICQTCEDAVGGAKYLQPGWYRECEHDPYVSYAQIKTKVPVYESLEDGTQKLLRTEEIVETKAIPNWVSITQSAGVNMGKGPKRAADAGFIYPQQLRSPSWPEGIKRRCQFRDCYWDEDLKQYNSGWFCREFEAKMVRVSDLEAPLRIGQFTRKAEMARQEQIDNVKVAL